MILHAIHTACGIETRYQATEHQRSDLLHAIHTACGIETMARFGRLLLLANCMQSIPLAVLKRTIFRRKFEVVCALHAIHTACGIETLRPDVEIVLGENCMQSIPLAVLKRLFLVVVHTTTPYCMQSIPLAVLKPQIDSSGIVVVLIACNPYRLRY